MMMKWMLMLFVVLLGGCGTAGGGSGGAGLSIEAVEVRVAESFPPQVFVQVRGTLPDGCTSLGAISQQRAGNTITIAIATVRSGAEVCPMIAQAVDKTIRLDGTFASGEYIVRVNGVERTFRI
jgi:hypothetical protein